MATSPTRCLSVVMPCFNERATVAEIIDRVLASAYVAEIIVVDDCSTDGTREILRGITESRVRVLEQPVNLGKGAALRRGFREATAEFVIVQDADLEYNPNDYAQVLEPLVADRADVVFGSRFLGGRAHRVLYYWHSVGNKILTTTSNMFTNLNLTDMETCYKAFRREVIQSVDIREDRFGFEPEITAKVARDGWRIYEVGISYDGRTYDEGKKIGWRDGVRGIYSIVRYSGLVDRATPDPTPGIPELDRLGDAPNSADWIADLVTPLLGTDVLEVEAGSGELTQRIATGRRVTALEGSKRHVESLTERFRGNPDVAVRHADVLDVAERGHFDSVLMVNVLESFDDDHEALTAARAILRPGGRLIVFAGAFAGLSGELDRRGHRGHRYRRSELVECADRAGLAVVEAHYVNAPGAVLAWALARVPGGAGARTGALVRAYDRLLVPALRRWDQRGEPGFGESLLLVAERPA